MAKNTLVCRRSRHGLFKVLMIIFATILYHTYKNSYDQEQDDKRLVRFISFKTFNEVVPIKVEPIEPKLILFGSTWWYFPHYFFLEETKVMCPKCTFTEDSSLFEISHAVVFHAVTLPSRPPIQRRRKDQIWVWFNFEAIESGFSAIQYTNMFNWTMTYRADSDIYVPIGRFVSLEKIPLPRYDETWAFMQSSLPNKTDIYDGSFMKIPTMDDVKGRKMAAWIVTNCRTRSQRELIVQELSKYIQIDIYGQCGNFKCHSTNDQFRIDCRFQISRKYKFYLSFENSLCEDYVTEKYFEALYTQMVPIVYGNANYSRIAPKNSYINVHDFPNVEALAKYLKFLDETPKEYLKYFEWRKNYWVQSNRFVTGYCDLCEKLWTHDKSKPKYYHSLANWWHRRSDFAQSGKMACVKPNSAYLPKPNR